MRERCAFPDCQNAVKTRVERDDPEGRKSTVHMNQVMRVLIPVCGYHEHEI